MPLKPASTRGGELARHARVEDRAFVVLSLSDIQTRENSRTKPRMSACRMCDVRTYSTAFEIVVFQAFRFGPMSSVAKIFMESKTAKSPGSTLRGYSTPWYSLLVHPALVSYNGYLIGLRTNLPEHQVQPRVLYHVGELVYDGPPTSANYSRSRKTGAANNQSIECRSLCSNTWHSEGTVMQQAVV